MHRIELQVPDNEVKIRLDIWLARQIPELSRSRIQELIKSGNVTVYGLTKVEADTKIVPRMRICVEIPPLPSPDIEPEKIELSVLFVDSDIIVVNKPPGMVVHPAPGHSGGTLVNALLYYFPELKSSESGIRPGIVHRLDKDTSGVMVVAKTELAMHSLANQFKHKAVTKYYLAIVAGVPQPVSGTVETLIGRNKRDRKRMQSIPIASALYNSRSEENPPAGRYARTSYTVMEDFEIASLLRIQPHTGRTHQIRVHMAYIGHPVLGDKQYGSRHKKLTLNEGGMSAVPERQMLHAETIGFTHPRTGKHIEFTAPVPEDMQSLLNMLRKVKDTGKNLQD